MQASKDGCQMKVINQCMWSEVEARGPFRCWCWYRKGSDAIGCVKVGMGGGVGNPGERIDYGLKAV